MNSRPTTWLPEHIEIATFEEVSSHVSDIWTNTFVPQCLQASDLFPPFDGSENIEIGLNTYALAGAIGNALKDIERWSAFHLTQPQSNGGKSHPDRHKYAGFLAKWIAKERPIYLKQLNPTIAANIPSEMYRLNAFFSVAVMQSYLQSKIPRVMAEELAYMLHFRDEKGETLAILAYCAEKMTSPAA